jgi:2-dehydropantoate 2-reductase
MRIAVLGAGAVGGYFGGRLAAAGADVTFIVRGRHGAALRENGLRVLSAHGDLHISPTQVLLPGETGRPFDIVLVAVKMYALAEAAAALPPLLTQRSAVVPLQNGVEAADIVEAAVGRERTAAGVAYIAGHIEEPGIVRHTGTLARLIVGELDGRPSDRLARFVDACGQARLEAQLSPKIEAEIWRKFTFLAPFAAITTFARSSIGPVRSDPALWGRFEALVREAVAVAHARGVDLPVDLAEERLAFAAGLPPEMRSSMLIDFEAGGPLELDWLLGAVVRLSDAGGSPVPVSRETLQAIRTALADADRA